MQRTARQTFVEALTLHWPISRVQLCERTGLSKGAASVISRELIERGLVKEIEPGPLEPGQFGRPAISLVLEPSSATFAGVCILKGAPLLLVLTDLTGGVIAQQQMELPSQPQEVAQAIANALADLQQQTALTVQGIGLALTGLVDHQTGICLHSANLGWHNVPIAELVEQATGLPTRLENDAHAVAISERYFGHARSTDDFSVITLGYSVGCAHFLAGELYRGHRGSAGEIAHITVQQGGERCRCGRLGCLDTVASHSALQHQATALGLEGDIAALEEQATAGNTAARALLTRAGAALGQVLASIVQINHPELLLILDEANTTSGLYHAAMREALENNILPRLHDDLKLDYHQVPPTFRARGAASVAAHAFLGQQTESLVTP